VHPLRGRLDSNRSIQFIPLLHPAFRFLRIVVALNPHGLTIPSEVLSIADEVIE
jgi:hypothetical protein